MLAGAADTLSASSAVTISGGTLNVAGYPEKVKSLTVDPLGTLDVSAANPLKSLKGATFDPGSTITSQVPLSHRTCLVTYSSAIGRTDKRL